LLPFQYLFSPAQRERFYALAEKSPATSPRTCIQLAGIHLNRGHTNDAGNLLLRAKALAGTVKDASSLESDIQAMAKKISPRKELKLEVTREICRELGFLELTNATQTFEQTRDLGRPLVFFGPGGRGVKVYSLTVSPPQKGSYPWMLVKAEDGGRSCSWGGFNLSSRGEWQNSFTFDKQTLKVTAVPLTATNRVKFTIRVEG
jgi:hypothetical protein